VMSSPNVGWVWRQPARRIGCDVARTSPQTSGGAAKKKAAQANAF